MRRFAAWSCSLLIGCAASDAGGGDAAADGGGSSDDASELPGTGGGGDVACSAKGPTEIELHTGDGLTLYADLWPSGVVGGPGVVLLHMIPPSNDRTNWPDDFAQSLVDEGITVLNVDRRGAGESEGDPKDAYSGPYGVLDAEAAFMALTGSQCEVPPLQIGFAGASNGTTTVMDFTVLASQRDDLEPPAAIAWLSPGGYTENQNSIADNAELLGARPILFMYPDAEAAFSEAAMPYDKGQWSFEEFPGGTHGAGLFDSDPERTRTLLLDHFADL